jgi:hypothetical protein
VLWKRLFYTRRIQIAGLSVTPSFHGSEFSPRQSRPGVECCTYSFYVLSNPDCLPICLPLLFTAQHSALCIKKRSHDGCWFCEPSHNSQDTPRMTRTHVLLRCVAFEEFRRETWTDPLTGEFTRPSSIGQLLGNPRWDKRLLKFLQHTKIGRIGPDLIDDEIRRVTRYEGWTDLVPDERSIDRGDQVADHILDTIVVRQT